MKKPPQLLPQHRRMFASLGEDLRLARLRRGLSAELIAERAGVSRSTLHKIERGDPSVAMGNYFGTLNALGMADRFSKLAAEDELGRNLQDANLRQRAPRRRKAQ